MDWQESFFSNLTKNYVGKFFIYLIVGLNFIFLVVATFKPAKSAINFYQYLYKQDRKIDNLVAINYNPFDICGPNVANFYLKSVPKTNLIKDSSVNGLVNTPAPQWIFTERPKQALRIKKMFPECKTVYGVSPEWIEKFGLFKRFLLKQRVWNLFWCKSE